MKALSLVVALAVSLAAPAVAATLPGWEAVRVEFRATDFRVDTYPLIPLTEISGVVAITYNTNNFTSYSVDEVVFSSSLFAFNAADCGLIFEPWYKGGVMFVLGGSGNPSWIASGSNDFMFVFNLSHGVINPAFFTNFYYSMDDGLWGARDTTMSVLSYEASAPLTSMPPSPVPLPSAVWLFASALGLGGLLGRGRWMARTTKN